ncbi:MAG: outer membrane protein [Acidobacteria bacterium]|jgi:outer membrane protein TolC|nr:outer membrane protein [Acidobacteriota bacterium]
MKRHLFILTLIVLSFGQVKAQTETPTPTPSPTPIEQKQPDDAQNVQPENLSGVPAIAPSFESDDKSLPDLGRVGVDMLQQKPLSLKEAISLALENNKDIEVSRQNVRIAEFDLQSADGYYEPRFTGQTFYERATVPNVSIFSTNATTTNSSINANAGFQGYLRKYGTVFNATANNQRLTTDNPISILSPQNNTSLNFSVTQPLLRGRSFDQPRRTIEIAKRNLSLTDTQFRQRSIEIITNVQRAYWDLTFSLRNLQVQRDGVRDAKQQLEHNRRLVDEGQLAPIDIVAAETQIANIEQGVYEALETVGRAENNLKNLISASKNDMLWSESIVPTDSVDLDAPNTTLPEALGLALANRPEVEVNNVQRDINEIDQRFYRDQAKPQVDLIASYTTSGVGGSQNPDFSSPFPSPCQTAPTSPACQQQTALLGNITGSSISDVFANRYPTLRVGVQLNLPLFGNKTTKAQLGRSLVQNEQIKTQREQIEQTIQVDVRNSLQSVRTSEARLRSAAISRENSLKQYESEQRKLDNGQSDVYKVLERQTALMNARSAELRAQTELNKAIADLQRATGNSLKANNVEARLRK